MKISVSPDCARPAFADGFDGAYAGGADATSARPRACARRFPRDRIALGVQPRLCDLFVQG